MTTANTTRRVHRWSVGIVTMVLVSLLAPAGAAKAVEIGPDGLPRPPATDLSDKGVGAISAADRDFIIKVRLAGLWEIPAGNMAQTMSNDPRVIAIGKEISKEHVKLDAFDRAAAAKLKIPLPDQPNADQSSWLAEMKNANSPATFDQVYIARLRAAHGKIFPAIANIRASTRNDIVRRVAQQANQFVMTHMTLLESSGLVDYSSLPAAPQVAATAPAVDTQQLLANNGANGIPGVSTSLILLVLAAAVIAGVVSTMRILRTR